MPLSVREGLKRLISSRTDLRQLRLSWFGGEPLVAKYEMYDVLEHALDHCEREGIEFISDITTNGYLLDHNTAKSLLNFGLNQFQISIDGARDAHNLTRRLASGQPTFDQIFENIRFLDSCSGKFTILLRIHYHEDNLDSVNELIDFLCDELNGSDHVELFFKNVSPLGSENDKDFNFVQKDRRESVLEGFRKRVSDRLSLTEPPDVSVCYACQANSFAIRADGKISKCTVALYDDFNIVGSLNSDGSVSIDNDKFRRWLSPLLKGESSEMTCPLRTFHA